MPTDEQIFVAGTAPAPLDYTVANSVELVPLVVRAVFDGTSAAGSFVPCVEIVSDGGVTVATCPALTEVSAGSSAECTFAPGFEGVASTAVAYVENPVVIQTAATAQLVAASPGHRIQVMSVGLMADGFVNVKFQGASDLTGEFPLAANTGFVLAPKADGRFWFQTATGQALTINLSAPANVGGVLDYVVV